MPVPHRLLRLLAALVAAVALAACGGGGDDDPTDAAGDDAGEMSEFEAAEAEAEAEYGDLPGAEITYVEIDEATDCAELQERHTRWVEGAERVDSDDRREVLEAYADHAEQRLEELECDDATTTTEAEGAEPEASTD